MPLKNRRLSAAIRNTYDLSRKLFHETVLELCRLGLPLSSSPFYLPLPFGTGHFDSQTIVVSLQQFVDYDGNAYFEILQVLSLHLVWALSEHDFRQKFIDYTFETFAQVEAAEIISRRFNFKYIMQNIERISLDYLKERFQWYLVFLCEIPNKLLDLI